MTSKKLWGRLAVSSLSERKTAEALTDMTEADGVESIDQRHDLPHILCPEASLKSIQSSKLLAEWLNYSLQTLRTTLRGKPEMLWNGLSVDMIESAPHLPRISQIHLLNILIQQESMRGVIR